MKKDTVKEIKATESADGLKVDIKADIKTAMSMLVALSLVVAQEADLSTSALYSILSGVTQQLESNDSLEDTKKSDLCKLATPVYKWIVNGDDTSLVVVIDKRGITLRQTVDEVLFDR